MALSEKVAKSIERLKAFEPAEGYYLAFSGGKDSVVCKHLMEMAGVKYDATYRVTSVDPPELVRFIKEVHPDVKREIPRYSQKFHIEKLAGKPITMWNLIPVKMLPPTRYGRFCCEKLKEDGGDGRLTVTGVRWAEGTNRKANQGIVTLYKKNKGAIEELQDDENFASTPRGGVILVNDNTESRRMVEQCYKRGKTTLNPIIDWSDAEVWEFIRAERIPYCELYEEGFHRLGCIGCPMAKKNGRLRAFARWPKYKDAYLRAFGRMLEVRKEKNRPFKMGGQPFPEATARDVFNWWMEFGIMPNQISFDDLEEDNDDLST